MAAFRDTVDATSARAELWERYDAGRIGADELEARLQLVDRAGDPDALAAALDGAVPFHRRRTVRRARPGVLAAVAVTVVIAVTGVVVASAIGDGREGSGLGQNRIAIAVDGVPVPAPPVTPVGVAGAAVEPATTAVPDCEEAKPRADDAGPPPEDLVFGDHILSDPPAVPEGFTLVDDFEVGAETDVAWQISAGDPPPLATWGRVLQASDESGTTIEMRGYEYESAEIAARIATDGGKVGICQYQGKPFDVPGIPRAGGLTVTVAGPTAYASFTTGAHRVIVAAKQPDLDLATEHAVAVLTAEWDALQAAQPAK